MPEKRGGRARAAAPAAAVARVLAVAGLAACAADASSPLRVTAWLGERERAMEHRILSAFAGRHPGVRVSLEAAPAREASRERILRSIAAGTPPDVVLLDDADMPVFAAHDALLDLAPYAARAGLDTAALEPRVREIFMAEGRLLAFPKGFTPIVVAYNKRLFDVAGVPHPASDWTWDDFLDAAQQLTRDTDRDGVIDRWGAAFERRPSLWIPWIWAGGGDVLCPSGRQASGCLDGPATRRAFRWYLDWVQLERIVPQADTLRRGLDDHLRLFAGGQVAMLTAGHAVMPELQRYVAEGRLSVGFAAIPRRPGGEPATALYASAWAVPRNVPRRRLAVELAAFLADSAAQRGRAGLRLDIPAHRAVAADLAAADTTGWEAAFQRAMTGARLPWGARVRGWREVEARLSDAIDQVLYHDHDPDDALAAAARDIDAILQRTE